MGETKPYILGKARASEIRENIELRFRNSVMSEVFKKQFLKELENYSFRHQKKDEPRHDGSFSWLEKLSFPVDFNNPAQYAILVKAEMDRFMQKNTAKRFYEGLVENF